MKIVITVLRIFTGLLFIFSGLVKAIDPKGLAYKMEEFFEAWSNSGFLPKLMKIFTEHSLTFSVIMITLEVLLGVALLVGWQKRITTWLLFLLMLFFTFLTSYVLFTGKIRACGCFGDCIPLTPIQTFSKDILLLIFSIILIAGVKYISPIAKPLFSFLYVLAGTLFTLLLQNYVLKNLPIKDCLPYKIGNNILELRKMPANAVPDKFDYIFVYEKNGEKREFKASAIPDSTWKFVDRKQTLVQKGSNNIPVINDYSLTTENGIDTTEALLSSKDEYYLMYIKDMDGYAAKGNVDVALLNTITSANKKIFIVSSQVDKVKAYFKNFKSLESTFPLLQFLSCDAVVMKTVARVNPTLYKMNGPIVTAKYSWNSFEKVIP